MPVCDTNHQSEGCDENGCDLYLLDTGDGYRLYAGKDFSPGDSVGIPEIIFPMYDVNTNSWSPWHDLARSMQILDGVRFESNFRTFLIATGLPNFLTCSTEHTIEPSWTQLHRSTPRSSPIAGALTQWHNFGYQATDFIPAGHEIHLNCPHRPADTQRKKFDVAWIQEHGICFDPLEIKPTNSNLGLGAYSKRFVRKGDILATSPLLHFDRNDFHIYKQLYVHNHTLPVKRDHGIEYSSQTKGTQVLLNYCYGHPDSNVLLLPLLPGLAAVNHKSEPNVRIRWSPRTKSNWLSSSSHWILSQEPQNSLVVKFEALKNIYPGDEVYLDYGPEWETAWNKHIASYEPENRSFQSAAEYQEIHAEEVIRTEDEQRVHPYPESIMTACYVNTFQWSGEDGGPIDFATEGGDDNCLRKCRIKSRYSTNDEYTFSALVLPFPNKEDFDLCGSLPDIGVMVEGIPWEWITLVNRPYTSDVHLKNAFRHEIGVPKGLFPTSWLLVSDNSAVPDFLEGALHPGEMQPLQWSISREVVAPFSYRLGLNKEIRTELLKYANDLGITEILRHVTSGGNPLPPGSDHEVPIGDELWFLQRPGAEWSSNLHWLSPGNELSHNQYLDVLLSAGFDSILQSIGETMGAEGLVAYQLTFIGVNSCQKGNFHTDFARVGGKAYNVIIPLILVEDSEPELGIQVTSDTGDLRIGRLKYEYEVAAMIGDHLEHATSAANYENSGEFRMAATVYIADVNPDNVNSLVENYT